MFVGLIGRSRISQKGYANPKDVVANLLFRLVFPRNVMKFKKIGSRGEGENPPMALTLLDAGHGCHYPT